MHHPVKIKLTKSITTLGPSSNTEDIIEKLVQNGSAVVRLNFSHGDYDEHLARIQTTRAIMAKIKYPISLMLDTKGPEIRTHEFSQPAKIMAKSIVKIWFKKEINGTDHEFSINYPALNHSVKVGSPILLDDGKLQLEVLKIHSDYVTAAALNTHIIKSRRGVNLPGAKLHLDFLSDKDKTDLKFGCEQKVDYVAASFVSSASDVIQLRRFLDQNNGTNIQIIAKIESQGAVENFAEILNISDGIMLARGDLGIEIPAEDVPICQSIFIRKTNQAAKPVIVATQMLESMIQNPRPTRAEVSDIYLACRQKVSATMLSGESANGAYPILAMNMMSRVICKTEDYFVNSDHYQELLQLLTSNAVNDVILATLLKLLSSQDAAHQNIKAFLLINAPRSLITKLASYHFFLPILHLTNNLGEYTAYGIYYAVKTLYHEQAEQLALPAVCSLFSEHGFLNKHFIVKSSKILHIKNNGDINVLSF